MNSQNKFIIVRLIGFEGNAKEFSCSNEELLVNQN